MIYYVTAKTATIAKKTAQRLQCENLADCYITPLTAISCLKNMEISAAAKTALRLDLLTVCDALIVVSTADEEMRREISLAELIKMEVIYIE